MRKFMLLLVSLLLAGAQMLQAQRTISGTVVSSEDNQGLPGVQVLAKGTTTGTTTNVQGQYSLNVPSDVTHLVFSFMGMATQEIEIGSQSTIDVVMQSGSTSLEGVVVTGYGVTRKVAFTGAATTVSEGVIGTKSDANVINSLQGSVPGLNISVNKGQPGASSEVIIRGLGSVSLSARPLYIVDGVPLTGTITAATVNNAEIDPLSTLNPDDIESISVLKDAAAAAIYGSRAANGVIVITTKKGKEGKTQFTFTAKEGRSLAPKLKHEQQLLNADEFVQQVVESYKAAGNTSIMTPSWWVTNRLLYLEPTITGSTLADMVLTRNPNDHTNTNWWDEVTRAGIQREYALSAQGGTEKTKFFVSGSYYKDEGYVISTGIDRYTGRINLSHTANSVISFGVNLSGSVSHADNTGAGAAGTTNTSSPIFLSTQISPAQPVRHTGYRTGYPEGGWNLVGAHNNHYNPVALWTDPFGQIIYQDQMKGTMAPYVQISILPNLIFQTRGGVDFYQNTGFTHYSQLMGDGVSQGGYSYKGVIAQTIKTITNTLNYSPKIGQKQNLNIMLGQEANTWQNIDTESSGRGFASPSLQQVSTASTTVGYSSRSKATLASYFGTAEYDYDNRYYVSASLRRDGSSRFSEANRWGTFYSLGAKWRISQEKFFAPLSKYFSNAMLRISYGTTGNQGVDFYASMGLDEFGSPYNAGTSLYPSSLENPELTWETRKKFDVGLDFELFSRISVELDFYSDHTVDMLFDMPVSLTTGFNTVSTNIGAMKNSGAEAMVNALLYKNKDIRWTLGLNFTHNKNKVTKLYRDAWQDGNFYREEGASWYQLKLKEYVGINPDNGNPQWRSSTDGRIEETWANVTNDERKVIGGIDPKLYGGFNTKVDAYGFDFSMQFSYRIGGYMNTLGNSGNAHNGNTNVPLMYYFWDNRWQKPGDNAETPRLVTGGSLGFNNGSTRLWCDGSFVKLKNITIGYTLPKKITDKARLTSARIYVQADNIWWKANKEYLGHDPDAPLGGALYYYGYMTGRNFHVGLNVKF